MTPFLKNNPFAVEAFFDTSLVLTFAVPKAELQSFIPECLVLDVFNGEWAFVAVALVQTKALRPKGFPRFLGNDFFLIGYRIFVRYTSSSGKRLRGLYILKSETDKKKMELLGNFFTKYKYATTDITQIKEKNSLKISSVQSGLEIEVELSNEQVSLPKSSPFKDWKEARRFAGPLPFTFSYNSVSRTVGIVEGVRLDWQPLPVQVIEYRCSFIDCLNLKQVQLANAFILNNVPYYWKKGKAEKWNG